MNEQIKREAEVHGEPWNDLHGGYFSDPEIAAPLVGTVRNLASTTQATTLVDLGGGTGNLLALLREAGVGRDVSLVNLDASEAQLATAAQAGLSCVRGSVDTFLRKDVAAHAQRCLFIMRSVLHYVGQSSLQRVLRHLWDQAESGEYFVHQTASFRSPSDADALNALYEAMGTGKWYPTVKALSDALAATGWHVHDVLPCASLPLTEAELTRRYRVDPTALHRILEALHKRPSLSEDVVRRMQDGFRASLHYWIYVCTR